jgi:hypothetical protein
MYSTYLFNYALPFTGALLGMGIAYIVKPSAPRGLKLILSFSGAFLLGITIFHLLPSVFGIADFNAGIWIVAGLVFQIVLEFLSQGAEHGHTHTHTSTRLPWVLFVSLCLHAFIEGIPMGSQEALVWGIFIHKIPIGMVLFLMIWQLRVSLFLKISCLIFFALMSPAGSFIFSNTNGLELWKTTFTSLVIGMLLHIATTILFESNQGHAFNIRKLGIILLGFGLSYLL